MTHRADDSTAFRDLLGPRASARRFAEHFAGLLALSLTMLLGACRCAPRVTKTSHCAPLRQPLPEAPADAPGRLVPEPSDEIAFLYDQRQLPTFELELDPEQLRALDADPMAEKYVPGRLIFQGKAYEGVGIRYKGSVGAWIGCTAHSTPRHPFRLGGAKSCPKLSLKISFNEFVKGGRFFGVKKLLFHAMNRDSSLMRERLSYAIYRDMGIPAPRANHGIIIINGEYAGIFANVEHVDGRFVESRFASGAGNLYKEIWPTYVEGLAPGPASERLRRHLRTNEKQPSFARMQRFGAAMMQPGGDARVRALVQWMNTDTTLRTIAVDRTLGVDDGPFHFYCSEAGCKNHNYYFYEEPDADRLWLIPWDMDNAFVVDGPLETGSDHFLSVENAWDDAGAMCAPRPGGGANAPWQMPPSCDPLLNTYGCYFREQYDRIVTELLDGPLARARVEARLGAWEKQIAAAVAEAHRRDRRQLAPAEWHRELEGLRGRIAVLRKAAEQRLR